jgi:hypothetical protein
VINLRNRSAPDQTRVRIVGCPRLLDFTQESFIRRYWIESRNGARPLPWLDTPAWLEDGCNLLDLIEASEATKPHLGPAFGFPITREG